MRKYLPLLALAVMLRVWWSCLLFNGNGIVIGVTKDGMIVRSDDGKTHCIDITCVDNSKWENVEADK